LYYVDAADRLTAVAIEKRGTELTIGEPRSLFEVSLSKWGKPYAVADGIRFLALRDVRIGESQPIVAILNGIAPAAK